MEMLTVVDTMSFNSRTPGGVRRMELLSTYIDSLFQFTHPGRGATPFRCVALYA